MYRYTVSLCIYMYMYMFVPYSGLIGYQKPQWIQNQMEERFCFLLSHKQTASS